MRIQTPTGITDPIFDDFLESSGEPLRGEATKAQIGRPEWWFLADILGHNWRPPEGDDVYLLVRMAYSLEPPNNYQIQEAKLIAKLNCHGSAEQPVAFDLFPREVKEETQTDLTIGVGPKVKFDKIEGSIGSVETTIHIPKVEPVIVTTGIGTANPAWIFRVHRRHAILGSRLVYAIIAYPSSANRMSLILELEATVKAGRFGFWPLRIPEKAKGELNFTIP